MSKRGIIVASFGTSHRDALDREIAAVEKMIAAAFPLDETRRAFTSSLVIRRLGERDGYVVDTVGQALEKMIDEGFHEVVVQPTHLIAGLEYEKIARALAIFATRLSVRLGVPLLAGIQDFWKMAEAVSKSFPRGNNKALCLMGHGSKHPSDSAYATLEHYFREIGRDDVFVGTVEGDRDFDAMRDSLRGYPAREVALTPLMLVAGSHVKNDLAGRDKNSWKSRLEAAGYKVECVLRGLGAYQAIQELYVAHIREAKSL